MSSLYFGKRKPYKKYAVLTFQKKLLEENYSFLSCQIINNVLTCTGWLQPHNCAKYRIRLEYVAGNEPKSTILHPVIEPSEKIHMYKDHSLCLHYPPDMKWNERIRIYEYTIPWVSEWIVYYEIYLLNGGIWEGKESPTHITESERNINQDID